METVKQKESLNIINAGTTLAQLLHSHITCVLQAGAHLCVSQKSTHGFGMTRSAIICMFRCPHTFGRAQTGDFEFYMEIPKFPKMLKVLEKISIKCKHISNLCL